jgi:arginine-tRNA-protein transferase
MHPFLAFSSIFTKCPYFKGEIAEIEIFYPKSELSKQDIDKYLAFGIRRFGSFFFRDICPHCKKCIPIRIIVNEFKATKSQRRIIRRNEKFGTSFTIEKAKFQQEDFSLYQKFLKNRFNKKADIDEYLSFFEASPLYMSRFSIEGKTIGIGFLDIGETSLSSIYFFFDTDYNKLSLGIYSALKEIEYAKNIGLKYYYLGYYIKELSSMNYKSQFKPYEYLDFSDMRWKKVKI